MRAFYRRWLKTAFTHSVGVFDLWTGLITAALGVVDHIWPQGQLMTTYAWQIPVWALAAVMAMRLLLAPYWMWIEDQSQPKLGGPSLPAYSRKKVEALRQAAQNLEVVCWGFAKGLVAQERIATFLQAAGEFEREPMFDKLLPRISSGAGRLSAMSDLPPQGYPGAADPVIQRELMQDSLEGIDELYAFTDQWVLYEGGSPRLRPDYPNWERRKDFRLWEVAALWADEEPTQPLSSTGKRRVNMLARAILDDNLELHGEDKRDELIKQSDFRATGQRWQANPQWTIRRSDLETFARGGVDRPPFLFPEARI
jgi:hypothetical protein